MNKDTLVASILGFSLGLVAAIALWVVPRIIPKNLSIPFTKSTQTSPLPPNQTSGTLDITTPKSGEIVKTENIKVEGKTGNDILFVVVSTAIDNQAVKPDSSGNFTTSLSLTQGANAITVTSYDKNKHIQTKSVSVYVFDENK